MISHNSIDCESLQLPFADFHQYPKFAGGFLLGKIPPKKWDDWVPRHDETETSKFAGWSTRMVLPRFRSHIAMHRMTGIATIYLSLFIHAMRTTKNRETLKSTFLEVDFTCRFHHICPRFFFRILVGAFPVAPRAADFRDFRWPWKWCAQRARAMRGELSWASNISWLLGGSSMEVSIAMGVPPNGWFIVGNPGKMDDLLGGELPTFIVLVGYN